MAGVSLGLVILLFRTNRGLFTELGLGAKEVTLLALGSVAGWAVNVPVFIAGGTYVAVNLGGAIVPLMVIGWWVRKRKIRLFATLGGTVIVSLVTWKIVEFHPSAGIVSRYPYFFLPIVIALVYALIVSIRRPVTAIPIAYASGTIGALVGADLLHLPEIRAHFMSSTERTIISIGGAGVFDMVFLAGTVAMALLLGIVTLLGARGKVAVQPTIPYPSVAYRIHDSQRAWASYLKIPTPNVMDRAVAGLALSDIALREGDYGRSVRMSWLAVDSITKSDGVRAYMGGGIPGGLHEDVARLAARYQTSRTGPLGLRDAGEANAAARYILGALAPRAGIEHRLEGVQ